MQRKLYFLVYAAVIPLLLPRVHGLTKNCSLIWMFRAEMEPVTQPFDRDERSSGHAIIFHVELMLIQLMTHARGQGLNDVAKMTQVILCETLQSSTRCSLMLLFFFSFPGVCKPITSGKKEWSD